MLFEALEQRIVDQETWKQFVKSGLPTKKCELFRYVRLSDLYAHSFGVVCEGSLPLKPQEGRLLFVNGRYCPELSSPPKEVVTLPLSNALKIYSGFLTQRLTREESDPFALLNRALSSEGLFLYIPPKCETRLEIVHHITEQKEAIILAPRLYLFAGKGSQTHLLHSYQAKGFTTSVADFSLDEEASLTVTTVFGKNPSSWHFDAIRATLKRGSRWKSFAMAGGEITSRQDYAIHLLEEGGEASLYGACQVEGKSHHHINVFMEHAAPHCRSHQHFKNVLRDAARTSFEGKIFVHPCAQKTEAYQRNHNLILGKRASANSKPNLEIFASDVKASHGATVGQIDPEQLFYLTSRGISEKGAKELLIQGFLKEILEDGDLCRFA